MMIKYQKLFPVSKKIVSHCLECFHTPGVAAKSLVETIKGLPNKRSATHYIRLLIADCALAINDNRPIIMVFDLSREAIIIAN